MRIQPNILDGTFFKNSTRLTSVNLCFRSTSVVLIKIQNKQEITPTLVLTNSLLKCLQLL